MNFLNDNSINVPIWIALGLVLLVLELIYFKIARRFSIVDVPNQRSSHNIVTIRGGGVIFYTALIFWFFANSFAMKFFMAGATLVAIISFMDDLIPQHAGLRFLVHLVAVLLLFCDSGVLAWPLWLTAIACIVCIGALNAFNFMDGINGITGIYALVNLSCFAFIQYSLKPFTSFMLIGCTILAVLIFLIFNFRGRAVCFAGDVGSMTLSFIQIFLLMQLIHTTDSLQWVLIFWVFGIDSIITIVSRLIRRENIFKPHRTHLYQYLCNELNWSHRVVAALYGLIQLVISVTLIYGYLTVNNLMPLVVALLFLFVYAVVRFKIVTNLRHSN
jgi:UDP-GlcNAc:undecaprenyl-phosphate/decaprenyl-phosphate GlcNAc-1-phosphate transferase